MRGATATAAIFLSEHCEGKGESEAGAVCTYMQVVYAGVALGGYPLDRWLLIRTCEELRFEPGIPWLDGWREGEGEL